MNDIISRRAALDCFHDWIDKHGNVYCADESEEYQRIEALPSASQWIPCSERLPDIEDHHVSELCLVCCKAEVEGGYVYGFAELEENIFGQVGWNCERDDEYHEPIGEVIAWMPLPEPYKGETDG